MAQWYTALANCYWITATKRSQWKSDTDIRAAAINNKKDIFCKAARGPATSTTAECWVGGVGSRQVAALIRYNVHALLERHARDEAWLLVERIHVSFPRGFCAVYLLWCVIADGLWLVTASDEALELAVDGRLRPTVATAKGYCWGWTLRVLVMRRMISISIRISIFCSKHDSDWHIKDSTPWVVKTTTQTLVHVFAKYWPVIEITPLAHSAGYLQLLHTITIVHEVHKIYIKWTIHQKLKKQNTEKLKTHTDNTWNTQRTQKS